FLERPAVQASAVGVAHEPRRARARTGRGDADARGVAQLALGGFDQGDDRRDDRTVVARGRTDAPAPARRAGGVERDELGLGAAEVDADAGRNIHAGALNGPRTIAWNRS